MMLVQRASGSAGGASKGMGKPAQAHRVAHARATGAYNRKTGVD